MSPECLSNASLLIPAATVLNMCSEFVNYCLIIRLLLYSFYMEASQTLDFWFYHLSTGFLSFLDLQVRSFWLAVVCTSLLSLECRQELS